MEKDWEDICINCGKCCLIKIQDDETDEIYFTNVVCKHLNLSNCLCTIYNDRTIEVPTCLKLSPDNVDKLEWMPKSCAYRGKFKGKTEAISNYCISELLVSEEDLEDHIIEKEDL